MKSTLNYAENTWKKTKKRRNKTIINNSAPARKEVFKSLFINHTFRPILSREKGATNELSWTAHGFKHKAPPNVSWKKIIKSTKHGHAYYKPGIDIKKMELNAWHNGIKTTNGKNWKVIKCNEVIGAKLGKETCYMRVECSANTIHGHPILESEYLGYLK